MTLMFSCAVFVLWKNTLKNRNALETWARNSFSVFPSLLLAILCQFPFLSLNNIGQTSKLFLTFHLSYSRVKLKSEVVELFLLLYPVSLIPGPTLCVYFGAGDFFLGTHAPFPSLVLPELGTGRRGSEDRSAAADWLPIWQGKLPAFALIGREKFCDRGWLLSLRGFLGNSEHLRLLSLYAGLDIVAKVCVCGER